MEIKRDFYPQKLIDKENNGLIKIVMESNSKFLSLDIVTEFRGCGDEIKMYPPFF